MTWKNQRNGFKGKHGWKKYVVVYQDNKYEAFESLYCHFTKRNRRSVEWTGNSAREAILIARWLQGIAYLNADRKFIRLRMIKNQLPVILISAQDLSVQRMSKHFTIPVGTLWSYDADLNGYRCKVGENEYFQSRKFVEDNYGGIFKENL